MDALIFDTTALQGAVIAAAVHNPEHIQVMRGILRNEMFTASAYSKAWEQIISMYDQHDPIEMVTVAPRVERIVAAEILKRAGDRMDEKVCIVYAQQLRTQYLRAKIYGVLNTMTSKVIDNGTSVEDLVAIPHELDREIRGLFGADDGALTISKAIDQWYNTLQAEQIEKQKGGSLRVTTGVPILDHLLYQGFSAGNLVVLGARPGHGKTAIALKMAREEARQGKHVLMFHLEMQPDQIAQRSILSTGMLEARDIMRGDIDWEHAEIAAKQFDNLPIILDHKSRTFEDISARIILEHNAGNCDIAYIDHLGLIKHTRKNVTLAQQLEEFTTGFKTLAMEQGIPIVILCQLNRESARDKREPELYDLRNSGAIEQDADIAILLQREETDKSIVGMYVKKNRQGEQDVVIKLKATRAFSEFTQTQTSNEGSS